jgi:hypothetical protein
MALELGNIPIEEIEWGRKGDVSQHGPYGEVMPEENAWG